MLNAHAEVLFDSFHREIDSVIFPSLSSPTGCVTLMNVVSRRLNFVPMATWLAIGPGGPCGGYPGVAGARRRRSGSERRRHDRLARPRRRRGLSVAGVVWLPARRLATGPTEVTARNEAAQAFIAASVFVVPRRCTRRCPIRMRYDV